MKYSLYLRKLVKVYHEINHKANLNNIFLLLLLAIGNTKLELVICHNQPRLQWRVWVTNPVTNSSTSNCLVLEDMLG